MFNIALKNQVLVFHKIRYDINEVALVQFNYMIKPTVLKKSESLTIKKSHITYDVLLKST